MNRMRKDNTGSVQKVRNSFFIKCDPKSNKKSDYKSNSQRKNEVSKFPKSKDVRQDSKTFESVKKPFDKKKWRTKKYSNKYKIEQWEDKRKKAVLRSYYRELKQSSSPHKTTSKESDLDKSLGQTSTVVNDDLNLTRTSNVRRMDNTSKKAHLEFLRIKEEKRKSKEEALKKKEEKKKAIEMSRQKKTEKFKRYNKRNKKGQPIMKDRIELLLEKLQHNMNSECG